MSGIVNVTIDYTKKSGGAALSAKQFSLALGAQTISLTTPSSLRASQSYSDDCIHIPTAAGVLGNSYNYVSSRNTQQLRDLIAHANLVICHLIFRYHNQLILQECVASNIPYIVVPHGGLDPYVFTYNGLQKRVWFSLLGKRFFRDASAVIFASKKEMAKAAERVSHRRGRVIGWHVPQPRDADRDTCKELVRSRYDVAGTGRLYLILGRLHSMKRIFEAIRGFKAADLKNVSLLIAGPEDEYTVEQVSAYAESIGATNVFAIGPVYGEEKDELMAACDLSLNTSHRENYCYSIVEAMSYGMPAVLTPGNDLASTLAEESCAICCADYEDASLVQALRRSAAMNDLDLETMRSAAKNWVRKNATYDTFQRNVTDLVKDVTNRGIGSGKCALNV